MPGAVDGLETSRGFPGCETDFGRETDLAATVSALPSNSCLVSEDAARHVGSGSVLLVSIRSVLTGQTSSYSQDINTMHARITLKPFSPFRFRLAPRPRPIPSTSRSRCSRARCDLALSLTLAMTLCSSLPTPRALGWTSKSLSRPGSHSILCPS